MAAMAVLLAALVGGLVFFRIPIAEMAGAYGLARIGLGDAEFSVSRLDFSGLELDAIHLGPDVSADSAVVSYSLSGLLAGTVERIAVAGAEVDVSAPEQGFLGFARRMVSDSKPQEESTGSLPPIPEIHIERARIHGRTEIAAFEATVHGKLTPEAAGSFRVNLRGDARPAPGRHLAVEGLAADISLGPQAKEASISFGGRVTGADGEFAAPPAYVTGNAHYGGDAITFETGVKLADTPISASLEGSYDLKTSSGRAAIDVPRTAAGALVHTALRHFVPRLPVDELSGEVAAKADVRWAGGKPLGAGELRVWNFAVVGPDGRFEGDELEAAADVTAEGAEVRWAFPSVRVSRAGRNFDIADLAVTTGTRLDGSAAELNVERAELRHLDRPQWFEPMGFSGSAALVDGKATFGFVVGPRPVPATLTIEGEHELASQSGSLKAELAPLIFDPKGLQPRDLTPLADLPAPLVGTVALTAEADWSSEALSGKLDVSLNGLSMILGDASFGGFSARISAATDNGGEDVAVHLKKAEGAVAAAGREIAVDGLVISGNLRPFERSGEFDIGIPTLRDSHFDPWFHPLGLTAKVTATDREVRFQGAVERPGKAVRAQFTGRHDVGRNAGRVRVDVSPLTFQPGLLAPADLSPQLEDVENLTGTLRGGADLRWQGTAVGGGAEVELDGVSLAIGDFGVEGLRGSLEIDELAPLTVSKRQTLSFDRLTGALPVGRSRLDFRIAQNAAGTGGVLYIDTAEAEVAGGRLSVADVVLDSEAATNAVDVEMKNVDLEKLMELAAVEGVSASGGLSGVIPLRFSSDRVFIERGRLAADGTGVLRVRSEEARQALGGGGAQVALLLDVLENFHYDALSLEIARPEDGNDVVSLKTSGRNPNVKEGHPFVLNINLTTDLEKLLGVLLEGYRLSEGALRSTLPAWKP